MKTATKIISLSSTFLISGLIGFFNFFFTSKVASFLENLKEIAKKSGTAFSYSYIYFLCYLITTILMFVCVLSLLFNNYSHTPTKKILQTMFLYVNICMLIISVICFLIVILKNYNLLETVSSPSIKSGIEYSYYINIFLLLIFHCLSNTILSILSLYYCKEDVSQLSTSNNKEQNDEKTEIKNEILKMKDQLELENLKNEYKILYQKLHQNNKDKNIREE